MSIHGYLGDILVYLGMTQANIVVVFCQAQLNIIWNVKIVYFFRRSSFEWK